MSSADEIPLDEASLSVQHPNVSRGRSVNRNKMEYILGIILELRALGRPDCFPQHSAALGSQQK